MIVVRELAELFSIYDIDSEVLAASIRHPQHVTQAALAGSHIATLPFKVLQQMVHHPLTDKGIVTFRRTGRRRAPQPRRRAPPTGPRRARSRQPAATAPARRARPKVRVPRAPPVGRRAAARRAVRSPHAAGARGADRAIGGRPRLRLAEAPPELLILLGAILVQGGGGIAARLLATHGAALVIGMQIGLAALILLAWRPPRRGSADARAWRLAILLGAVMAVMNSLFYLSIARIPLGVAVTIEFWGPLTVAVLGSRRARDLIWVVLAAAGIWLLAGGRAAAPVERDLRRPDEPGAGRRGDRRLPAPRPGAPARQRWWRSSSSAWPAPARASRHAPSRSFPRSWSPREAACRPRGSCCRCCVGSRRTNTTARPTEPSCLALRGRELGLRRRSYECSAEMSTRGTPSPILRPSHLGTRCGPDSARTRVSSRVKPTPCPRTVLTLVPAIGGRVAACPSAARR